MTRCQHVVVVWSSCKQYLPFWRRIVGELGLIFIDIRPPPVQARTGIACVAGVFLSRNKRCIARVTGSLVSVAARAFVTVTMTVRVAVAV